MKFTRFLPISTWLAACLLLSACGTPAPAVPATVPATLTPDPCAPANIKAEAQKVNRLMREFDDASALASSTPRTDIRSSIVDMQRIRRDAEDLEAPACLVQLQKLEIAHMNTVINTLLGFMGGADAKTTSQGIGVARQLHDAYTIELARVLGLTIVAPTASAAASTPTPGGAASATLAANTPTSSALSISVPGPSTVNLRKTPSLDGETLGILKVGSSANVVGKNNDGSWLLIEVPDQAGVTAWVYAPLVTLVGNLDQAPVVTATP